MKLKDIYSACSLVVCLLMTGVMHAQLSAEFIDFEAVDPTSENALADQGIQYSRTLFEDFGGQPGYVVGWEGPLPVLISDSSHYQLASGVGAGDFSLSMSTPAIGGFSQERVLLSQRITADDVGKTFELSYQYRRGESGVGGRGTSAFIQTFSNNDSIWGGGAMSSASTNDATNAFQTGTVTFEVVPGMQGRWIRYGFSAFGNGPSEMYYDNIRFSEQGAIVIGDLNGDFAVNLLDIGPFVDLLVSGGFTPPADINSDGAVDLLDVPVFIELLSQ